MLDIKFLRENPEVVKQNIRNKFQDRKLPMVDEVIALDQENRDIKQEVEALRAERNKQSKEIGKLMGQGKREEAEEIKKQIAEKADRMNELSEKEKEVEEKIRKIMMVIPNIIDPSVPIGKDDSENVEIEKFGEPYYRALETVALKQLIQDPERKVISLGAGVPLQEQNEKYLKELGTVVYLKGSLTTLKKRLADSKKDPMLDGEDRDDKIKKLLKQRDPVYQKFADIQVVTGEVPFEELIKEIEEKLSTYEKNS